MGVFVILFSLFSVPVSASVIDVGEDLWSWIKGIHDVSVNYPPSTFWNDLWASDDPDTAYSDYVSSVDSTLGTSVVGNNCAYLGNWSLDVGLSKAAILANSTFSSGSTFVLTSYYDGTGTWTGNYVTVDSTFIAPVTGTYLFAPDVVCEYNNMNMCYSSADIYLGTDRTTKVVTSYDTGFSADFVAGNTYTMYLNLTCSSSSAPWSFTTKGACRVQYPDGLTAAAGDVDLSPETRTGSLCGDYFYEGDGGTMMQAENINFVDETNNTTYNPATGETKDVSDWTYDYSDRAYQVTCGDGTTAHVVYGDESVTYEVTDNSGNTTTYNYYYGTSSSSGGSSSDSDSDSIWTKLGNLFGSITDGFLEVLKAFISKLLDGLTSIIDLINSKIGNIVNSILSLFDYIPTLFGGFTSFLSAVFPFLPQEFFDILILGAALFALILIIKAIRR